MPANGRLDLIRRKMVNVRHVVPKKSLVKTCAHRRTFVTTCRFVDLSTKLNGVILQKSAITAGRTSSLSQVSKGKAVPLQAWSGPEGSRKLRFPDYMTAAQDSGKVVSLTHRPPLPPENIPGTHFCSASLVLNILPQNLIKSRREFSKTNFFNNIQPKYLT
jgi:hypothetical protein